ncbi:MAG: PIN domain-containing protein [Acidobacteriota bacterium]|nr:PIN domain-containing protein [Acidobacteriota bacterium]
MTEPLPHPVAQPVESPGAIFVDANVFMYAGGVDVRWRETCDAALGRLQKSKVRVVTNAEVLQEILHRYFSQQRPGDAQTVHRAARELCDEIIPVTEGHTNRALALLLEHQQLPARDAIHVATMEDRGIRTILSADRDFDPVPSVDRIDPRDFVRA